MIVLAALVIAVLFGAGSFLMLKRDLFRVVAGVIVISYASILFIMASAMFRGAAPIYPQPAHGPVSDPLVQALALTAIVISFGTTALLLALLYRVYKTNKAFDQTTLVEQEQKHEEALEQEEELA